MRYTNNINVVRVFLTGESIIYLPQNSDFANKKIGRIFVSSGLGGDDGEMYDPFTNKKLIRYKEFDSILLTLVNKEGRIICKDVPLIHWIVEQYDRGMYIDDYIDWHSSYVNILNAKLYAGGEELLLYITYDDVIAQPYQYYRNVINLEFPGSVYKQSEPMPGNPQDFNLIHKLAELINDPNLGRLVCITGADIFNPELWLTIYDKSGRCFQDLFMFSFVSALNRRYSASGEGARLLNFTDPIYFNNVDIDFERSTFFNNIKDSTYLTFYFV